MIALPVTSLYAGLGALLMIALAARIAPLRRRHRVGINNGGKEDLALAMRAHGNAVENLPLGLILLALLEVQGLHPATLYLLGGGLILGRLLHAWGLSQTAGISFGRFWGMLLSWISLLAMSGILIWFALPLSQTVA
ncbi:putative membrane protein YecN with MAPEG domain [Natronospira proteinivora]|uniref:Membrane protein YecN with MAPEG domain n=1 Tax=Natronospira proteinivora TaxID=1807133 RepID=A0ABT1G432_9GAMM|nr:MAPEG family protein [Natronospira proteinivora]MCP1726062.1 putative membrane protein YecN with MAPEG domain [Natronospira proteinivora]